MPESGCPIGTNNDTLKSSDTCCCGNECCWDECRLSYPPADCLNMKDYQALWKRDTQEGFWVAQSMYRIEIKTKMFFEIQIASLPRYPHLICV